MPQSINTGTHFQIVNVTLSNITDTPVAFDKRINNVLVRNRGAGDVYIRRQAGDSAYFTVPANQSLELDVQTTTEIPFYARSATAGVVLEAIGGVCLKEQKAVNMPRLYGQGSDGGGSITGSGVAGQVTIWTATSDIGSDSALLYDSALNSLRVGNSHTTAGANTLLLGENNETTTSGEMSVAIGNYAIARHRGQIAQSSGRFSTIGDAQTSVYVLRAQTTDATPTELFLSSGEYLTMENNSAYTIVAHIVAKENSTQNSASYILKFNFDRGATAATSTVNGSIKEVIHEYNTALDVNPIADTTNGRAAIEVTGLPATTIRWVARVEVTEVK